MLDDTTTHNSDSATAVATETEPTAAQSTSTEKTENSLIAQGLTQQGQAPATSGAAPAAAKAAAADEAPHPGAAADDKHASEAVSYTHLDVYKRQR